MRIVPKPSSDESGVTVVIVVLCLTVFMGMMMLVVDVGGLLLARKEMVNGADAAALGAAQSCAGLPGVPADEADALASENINGDPTLTRLEFAVIEGTCPGPSGKLRVKYQVSSDLTFAPALGFDDNSPVVAEATAMWGSSGASNKVVPVMLGMDQLQGNCRFPDVAEGEACSFWNDNEPDELGNAQWGFLNLDQWDVTSGANCSSAGASDRSGWIEGGYPDLLSLHYPSPTYVCADSGAANSVFSTLRGEVGDILIFPINDEFTQLPGPPPATPDKYNIIGFASLELVAVYDGNQEEAIGTPGTPDQRTECGNSPLTHEFTTGAREFGISTMISNCEALNGGLAVLEPPVLPGTEGTTWTYDASTNVIKWLDFGNQSKKNVSIRLDYVQPGTLGTPGACEPPERTPDRNAKCLVTRWVGFQFGGSNPGGGIDFGYSAVRLDG